MQLPMRAALSVLLCLALCLVCLIPLASCGSGTEESGAADSAETDAPSAGETSTAQKDPYKDENGKYTLNGVDMPAFTFTEKEFRVLVYNNSTQDTYFSEEIEPDMYETTDSVLNEAVRTRNDLLEERYGVTVKAVAVADAAKDLADSVLTATDICDAAMPFFQDAATLAQDGVLYDLKQFGNYLHLDAPWWDQSANEMLSIDRRLYFTTGDISIMQKIVSGAILFNKTLYDQLLADTYGNLYDIVKDYKWTFDLMCEMTRGLNRNLDEDPALDAGADFFGMGSANGNAISFYLASGAHIIDKDAEDLPYLAIGKTENTVRLAQHILEELTDPDFMLISEDYKGKVSNCWEYCLKTFGENRCVMRTTAFSAIKKLRNFDGADPFGIVPFPLANAQQDAYYAPCGGTYAFGVCIPINARDPEFSAFMLEAMCCEGKNTITPAYYETTLKSRDLAYDDESAEMLDQYIFQNILYDLGVIYNFGGIRSMFGNLMTQKSADIVSNLDSIRSQVEVAIDGCVEVYRSDAND